MSLNDRTNERIPLSQHQPQTFEDGEWGPAGEHPAELYVDLDFDSSCEPPEWVHVAFTDDEHDSDRIKMTKEEASLLRDRLNLILDDHDERILDTIVNALPEAAETDDVAGEALVLEYIGRFDQVDQHIYDRLSADDYSGEVILFRFDPTERKIVPLHVIPGTSDGSLDFPAAGKPVDGGQGLSFRQRHANYEAAAARAAHGLPAQPDDARRLAEGDPTA